MKKVIVLFVIAFATNSWVVKASASEEAIREVVSVFSEAVNKNDVAKLEKILDNNHRVVMNRLFGSSDVSVMTRAVYMEKIRTKEFGGDDRKFEIKRLIVSGNTASVEVLFTGSKLSLMSVIILIQDDMGNWKFISDFPRVVEK